MCQSCESGCESVKLRSGLLTSNSGFRCEYRVVVILRFSRAEALPVDEVAGAGWRERGDGVFGAASGHKVRRASGTVIVYWTYNKGSNIHEWKLIDVLPGVDITIDVTTKKRMLHWTHETIDQCWSQVGKSFETAAGSLVLEFCSGLENDQTLMPKPYTQLIKQCWWKQTNKQLTEKEQKIFSGV